MEKAYKEFRVSASGPKKVWKDGRKMYKILEIHALEAKEVTDMSHNTPGIEEPWVCTEEELQWMRAWFKDCADYRD